MPTDLKMARNFAKNSSFVTAFSFDHLNRGPAEFPLTAKYANNEPTGQMSCPVAPKQTVAPFRIIIDHYSRNKLLTPTLTTASHHHFWHFQSALGGLSGQDSVSWLSAKNHAHTVFRFALPTTQRLNNVVFSLDQRKSFSFAICFRKPLSYWAQATPL